MQSINCGELLPMHLGQIPYTLKQKRGVQYWSMRWIEQKIYTEGVITWPRGNTKFLF